MLFRYPDGAGSRIAAVRKPTILRDLSPSRTPDPGMSGGAKAPSRFHPPDAAVPASRPQVADEP
jgi:hypothetical protein